MGPSVVEHLEKPSFYRVKMLILRNGILTLFGTGGGAPKYCHSSKAVPKIAAKLPDFLHQYVRKVLANFRGFIPTGNIFFEFFPRPCLNRSPNRKTVRFFLATSKGHNSASFQWIDLKFCMVTRGDQRKHRGVSVCGHAHF